MTLGVMIDLRKGFDQKAEDTAVKRTKPSTNYKPSPVEKYPNDDEHTMENTYKADSHRDEIEE